MDNILLVIRVVITICDKFSEDVDFAVISENMSGNQVKMLLSHLMKEVTANLKENRCFGDISKGTKYRKQAFLYETQVGLDELSNPVPARIIVEISAFANSFPHERRIIEPFVTSRPLNTLYYTDLQLIISLFICIFLQVFVPLQYKTCRNIC